MSTRETGNHLPPRRKDGPNPELINMQKQVLVRFAVPITMVAFILAIVAITNNSWATVSNYDSLTRTFIGTSTRGPFKYCLLVPNSNAVATSNNPADYHRDCSVQRCTSSAPNYDELFFCQQLRYSGNLLIAGAVFLGLTMLMTFPATAFAASMTNKRIRGPPYFFLPLPGCFYALFIVFGFVLFAAGNILGAEVLVNQQKDDGDFISIMGSLFTVTDHWMVGNGVWIGFSAWIMGLIGAVMLNEASLTRWHAFEDKNIVEELRNDA